MLGKLATRFLIVCTLLVVTYGLGKSYALYTERKARKAQIKREALHEKKSFVVLVPSYNNSRWCTKNLRSILTQEYPNFRVVYIDDASNDGTYEQVSDLLAQEDSAHRVTLIHNEQRRGVLSNLYHAIRQCHDEEIIVTVDGDDFLAHEGVLKKLNSVYADHDVWMTYGSFLDYPSYRQSVVKTAPVPKQVIASQSYRKYEWVSSHLRTFYAKLFKQIKSEDLKLQGEFLPMAGDLAFMFPMLEMSGRHARYLPDILYLYNRANPLNEHKVDVHLQARCAAHVRSLPTYGRLKVL